MGFRTLCPKTKNTRGGGRGILLISQTSSLCLGDSVAIPSVVSFDPVNILLNEVECRVLGSLIEKEITTPEYYPLSLNALVNACNQKSNRDPVMNLDEAAVRQALHSLDGQSLVRPVRSEEHTSALQSHSDLVFRLLPDKNIVDFMYTSSAIWK